MEGSEFTLDPELAPEFARLLNAKLKETRAALQVASQVRAWCHM